jgi:NAD(P)-dependent dehydrogenase (short-subunit alcohol dehydrogenase family)
LATPRIIVLTGATRGLGRALLAPLTAAGHTILGCGRSTQHINELKSVYDSPHDFTALDVTDAEAVSAWAERLLEQYGPPDLLLNNAAVINTPASLWEVPTAEFDRIIDINIKGVANVIRAFVPAMVARKHGVIVNWSSGWGRSTSPEVAPYCATKFAIEGMTRALAQELPRTMAAIPLNPGVIDTDMLRQCFGGSAGAYPSADRWAQSAAPFLLRLGPADNGQALSVVG